MPSFSFSSSLPILVFSLLFLLPGFPVSHSNPELFYENCRDAVFECGKISIGYPFFGGFRQPGCGHPGLELHCEYDTDTPTATIEINGVKYQVLDIRREIQTLTIARGDYLINDGFCRPQTPIHDSIIDSELFDPVPGYTNVTLLYDCPSFLTSRSLGIPCDNSDYHNGSVLADDMRGYGEGCSCSANVTFPISGKRFEFHNDPDLFRSLGEVLKTGFEVKWKEDTQACRNCTASGGACGFNFTQTLCSCPLGLENSIEYPNECQDMQLPLLHLNKFF